MFYLNKNPRLLLLIRESAFITVWLFTVSAYIAGECDKKKWSGTVTLK